ncbi:hypothetical protein PSA01_31510 [Pseudonocardia saturnea]|uniref:Uncharacterized protein n=1 Tax=Pseudonocardia saturnea TaxID=33909 RepID=A0ABQ0RZM3_9PSEU|nr:hypothetical protein Pdca_40120 [Pseudonocardia autotrophica]GEC26122.1 hypothetical protein PSA01_31510 [Pseudonocardia saturnea]
MFDVHCVADTDMGDTGTPIGADAVITTGAALDGDAAGSAPTLGEAIAAATTATMKARTTTPDEPPTRTPTRPWLRPAVTGRGVGRGAVAVTGQAPTMPESTDTSSGARTTIA